MRIAKPSQANSANIYSSLMEVKNPYIKKGFDLNLKYAISVFDSSNAVLGMAFTHPPPRKGDSVLYCRDELCTA